MGDNKIKIRLLFLVPLVVVSFTASAAAKVKFSYCETTIGECAYVKVPLDYSGYRKSTLKLFIAKIRSYQGAGVNILSAKGKTKSKKALFAFAGGPGQGATPLVEEFADSMFAALEDHDLIVFDQRGTGESGALRCPKLAKAGLFESSKVAADCQKRLGFKSNYYRTIDTVRDIESIRKQLGYKKISLYGVSYGTKVIEGYAQLYPNRTERLIIDSVVLPEGPDSLYRSSFVGMRRALRLLCEQRRCQGITEDIVDDLSVLVAQSSSRPVVGTVFGRDGKKHSIKVGKAGLFSLILAGDFDPTLRSELPAALRSARDGDTASLMRLMLRASSSEEIPDESPKEFSLGLYAATTCTDSVFPWGSESIDSLRAERLAAEISGLDPASLLPFNRSATFISDSILLCKNWLDTPAKSDLTSDRIDNIPALILSGSDDLRTPLEDGKILKSRMNKATLVSVPATGHSVLGSDFSGCAQKALEKFLEAKKVNSLCKKSAGKYLKNAPLPPLKLSEVQDISGVKGRRGKLTQAAILTLKDALRILDYSMLFGSFDTTSIGGLRGGYMSVFYASVARLNNYQYLPGLRLTGTVEISGGDYLAGKVRLSGLTKGYLRFTDRGRVTGVISGKKISVAGKVHFKSTVPTAFAQSVRKGASFVRGEQVFSPLERSAE